MMATKERNFSPLTNLSLEELVPEDNFYRRLERTVDLSFVRELVRDRYASGGRPSVDPVVFFKLQLVLFFEDLRSERRLMEVAADRLSIRWYLGYDLTEPLPDHSSLTYIRQRYGLEIFRRFFEEIVELCVETGLVCGEELFFDSTKVEANASMESLLPRFASRHIWRGSSRTRRLPRQKAVSRDLLRRSISTPYRWPIIKTFGQRTSQRATGYRETEPKTARLRASVPAPRIRAPARLTLTPHL
jgi:transposase